MNRERLLAGLIQQYLFVTVFRALAESAASEQASRLTSMQAAEQDIQERLDKLTQLHNQQRQQAITPAGHHRRAAGFGLGPCGAGRVGVQASW
jgi:F-type H+-transporting ATPase subunit gamma